MANLPYGRPGSPSWNYAMRQQAASRTYDQNNTSAVNSYAQSQLQIDQARNSLGNMGSDIADLNFNGAKGVYQQTNTLLGYAQLSADAGYEYTNQMKPQADTPERLTEVTALEQTYFNLNQQIGDIRNNSSTLLAQASEGEYTSRVITSTETLADDSAGAIVAEQQRANAERADVQNPAAPDQVLDDNGNIVTLSGASNLTNADEVRLAWDQRI